MKITSTMPASASASCQCLSQCNGLTGLSSCYPNSYPPDLPGVLKSFDLVCGRCTGVPTFIIDMLHLQEWPKPPFLVVFPTFFKKGRLGFAHICSTCSPDLCRASCVLKSDGSFCEDLPWRIVRCAVVL